MTHSVASAKCPNVLSSGNYGMSQNRYTDDTKDYIFVKLTDSAFRAIEEYQFNERTNRLQSGQCPKIQFFGKTGIIHIPSPEANAAAATTTAGSDAVVAKAANTGRKFGFAIDNIEGSFECIQQHRDNLDVLGSMQFRMRIHANDDVYDTTRTKMAIAEETEKSKCIREIKPNQSDIGRKVKKPGGIHTTVAAFHNGNNSNSINMFGKLISSPSNGLVPMSTTAASTSATALTSSSSSSVTLTTSSSARSPHTNPNPITLGGSGTINQFSSSGNIQQQQQYCSPGSPAATVSSPTLTTAARLSSTFAGGISHGYAKAAGSSPRESTTTTGLVGTSVNSAQRTRVATNNSNPRAVNKNSFGSGSGNNGSKGATGSNSGGAKMPDVSRRKIRERLIHLLALKPFKKPELYSRLQNEGIRERERSLISNILRDISSMSRDNTYNLRRQMWNDVDENWPFFTEQELQQLKRRKPQNLTPPMSSDAGSSTSGQSPTSTHTGSPPPLVGVGSNSGSNSNSSSSAMLVSAAGSDLKRPSLEYDDNMFSGVVAKKQRISHYKKEVVSLAAASRLGSYGSSSGNRLQSSYSPQQQQQLLQQQQQQQDADEYNMGGGSDLSYSVLDNIEFMPQLEQQSSSNYTNSGKSLTGQNGNSRGNSTVGGNNVSISGSDSVARQSQKEKRRNASNSSGYETHEHKQSTSSTAASNKKTTSSSAAVMGPNKKTTAAISSSTAKTVYGNSFVPESKISSNGNSSNISNVRHNYKSNNKTNNGVIYPGKVSSPHDENNSSSSKPRRAYLMSNRQQQEFEESQYKLPQRQQGQQQTEQQQRQHPSPTQQLAAAAHSYASVGEKSVNAPRYDFSNYTPILTLEQRRRYKTEFENDYDEYRKLLSIVENVRKRFQELSERLDAASKRGTSDYNHIKLQILSEYTHINNEESIRRDKMRFDYLHAKLAHIKQLVMDYDKTLTSGVAMAAPTVQQQQQKKQEQQQYMIMGASGSSRITPVMNNESNYSSPLAQQQQQQLYYHQYHAAETIENHAAGDDDNNEDDGDEVHQQQLQHHRQQQHHYNHEEQYQQQRANDDDEQQQDSETDDNSTDSSDDDSNSDDDDEEDDDEDNDAVGHVHINEHY